MASQEHKKKSHKRKSTNAEASTSDIPVTVSEPSSSVGPAFANFPSVRPSKHLPYGSYSNDPGSSKDITLQKTMIAGQTEDVEFFSSNRMSNTSDGTESQYLPAIYDPDAGTLHINASTPLYLMVHRAKRMKRFELDTSGKEADYRARRNELGEAFGTKKAKSQIKAEERNKLDAGAMEGIKGHYMETIGEIEEKPVEALPSDLIPLPNISTDDPASVYPRESLLPDAEWRSIDANALLKARDDRARVGLLPHRWSRYVENQMRNAVASQLSTSEKKSKLRMAYFLSCLFGLKELSTRLHKIPASDLPAKFPGVSPSLRQYLLDTFSQLVGSERKVTEKLQTKLLSWICVTCLHLENFSLNIAILAKELNMQSAKLTIIFKSLGCKTDLATPAEREQMGITNDEAKASRRAVLKAPVKFPKPRTRAPARR